MGLRRTISTAFWEDGWVELLTPREKLAFVYLFSCPATNPSGLFKLSLRRMAFETGLPREETDAAIAKFEEAKRIMYDPETTVVWVVHFRDYHGSRSPNWLKGVRAAVEKIPDCSVKRAYLQRWPIGTLPLPLDQGDDGSDPGQPLTVGDLRDGSAILDEVPGGSAKVATRQGQGQRQSQGQGQGQSQSQLEGQGASQTDQTELADPADALPDQSQSSALTGLSEPEIALFWEAVEWREKADGAVLVADELQQMMRWQAKYGSVALRDAAQKAFKGAKENPGGYMRVTLRSQNEHGTSDPDAPT